MFPVKLECIYIYKPCAKFPLSLEKLVSFIKNLIEVDIKIRNDFFSHYLGLSKKKEKMLDEISRNLALIRVREPARAEQNQVVFNMDLKYERANLLRKKRKIGGVYDGYKLVELLRGMIPEKESFLRKLHLILTEQLIATFQEDEKRYHLRMSLYGQPSIISLPGIVEAPAKPREFYVRLKFGEQKEMLEREFSQEVISRNDSRMQDVVNGLALQAVFSRLFFAPFCEDSSCLLFNAHWHKELIKSKVEGTLCRAHKRMLEEYRKLS